MPLPEIVAGPYHRFQDTVLADGYMYRFLVDSQFGVFDVTGTGALRKLTREIQVIAAIRELKKGENAVMDSATGPKVRVTGEMPAA